MTVSGSAKHPWEILVADMPVVSWMCSTGSLDVVHDYHRFGGNYTPSSQHLLAGETIPLHIRMALGWTATAFCFLLAHVLQFPRSFVRAQSISTSIPLPPLQWINLSNLLQGSAHPPPLKDAAIGYDENSRSVIIFGGESQSGFPQSQTYILNMDTLTWSIPSPPANLQSTPPARSAFLAGDDFAASNRHGFVVIGGKGEDGNALSDVWEYDFVNQFWSPVILSPGGPSARWGSSGGIDIRTAPIQDPIVAGPNNTFYLAGGFDGTQLDPLSDIWRLKIAGTLSSNLPNSAAGSWEQLTTSSLPQKFGQGSTVLGQQIISVGGCNTTSDLTDDACAQQDSYVTNVQNLLSIAPGSCPAPRLSPVLTPNLNSFTSSFSSQVFLLLGTFNSSLWQDDGALLKGEIAVLDTNTGTWSRILPSGDPGSSGDAQFPSPREGAAVFSYTRSLVGQSRNISADTIVFGGRNAMGQYLSEIWLLRAYSGLITPASPKWSGFGNGQLQTGVNADGSGVNITYLSQCVSPQQPSASLGTSSSSTTASPTSTPTSTPTSGKVTSDLPAFDTSLLHKLFAPLSLVIILPVILIFRATSSQRNLPERFGPWMFISLVLSAAAYGVGIAGLVFSFTTIRASNSDSLQKRALSSPTILKTSHGKAGLAFFICFYLVTPLAFFVRECFRSRLGWDSDNCVSMTNNKVPSSSVNTNEKLDSVQRNLPSTPPSVHDTSPLSTPRRRTLSWGPSGLHHKSHEGRMSTDSESIAAAAPHRGFEVLNRPARLRRNSDGWPADDAINRRQTSRSLGDIDWLLRRRSLNAVGELDYALTQAHNAQVSAHSTGDALVVPASQTQMGTKPTFPDATDVFLHSFFQISLLGLCVICVVALWSRAPKSLFAIFLTWVALFYVFLLALAWRGYPEYSALSIFFKRLRSDNVLDTPLPQLQREDVQPYGSHSPYIHQPLYHNAADDLSISNGGPQSAEAEDVEDDIDDDTRQRMIEDEMGRREVSIITVPRRKLRVANPS